MTGKEIVLMMIFEHTGIGDVLIKLGVLAHGEVAGVIKEFCLLRSLSLSATLASSGGAHRLFGCRRV